MTLHSVDALAESKFSALQFWRQIHGARVIHFTAVFWLLVVCGYVLRLAALAENGAAVVYAIAGLSCCACLLGSSYSQMRQAEDRVAQLLSEVTELLDLLSDTIDLDTLLPERPSRGGIFDQGTLRRHLHEDEKTAIRKIRQ